MVIRLVLGTFLLSMKAATAWSNYSQQSKFMRECISLAQVAAENGGAPYGALIADPDEGMVMATGRNDASLNPIWHGEIAAISNLSSLLGDVSVYSVAPKLELYTTAEPCSMCMSAITWSGFGRVYYGTSIPFIEAHGADQIELRATEVNDATPFNNVTIIGGVLANETDPLYTLYWADRPHQDDHNHGHNHDHDHHAHGR